MTDIVEMNDNGRRCMMGAINRGDVKLAYDRAVAHDVEDVADMLVAFAEHISRLEKQHDKLLAVLEESASYINQTYSDLIGSISAEWLAAKYADDLLPKIKSAIASVKKN